HVVPTATFGALATSRAAPSATKALQATRLSRNLQLVHLLITQHIEDLLDAAELLTEVQKREPSHAATVLTYPWVSTWARLALRQRAPARVHLHLRAVAVAAAIRAG